MAMEIKTLEIKNSEEQSTIEFWTQFGWQLKSSQRVYNKDSHLESRGDSTYSVTETVDFTKLVFERDKNGPNYSKIVELEKEYFSKAATLSNKPTVSVTYDSLEKWARATKQDVRNGVQKALFYIMLIGGIALVALLEVFNSPITMALQVAGIVSIVLSFITKSAFKKSMLNKAINGKYPAGTAILNIGFDDYKKLQKKQKEDALAYKHAEERLDEILRELDELI